MPALNPYLLFDGNAEEAVTFYQSVFGGEVALVRFGDMGGDTTGMPPEVRNRVANAQLPLSETNILMVSDCPPGNAIDNSRAGFQVQIEVESKAEAERLFDELGAGGTVEMPLAPTEWAELFAIITDKFSVPWMINYTGNVTM